jgi:hypothetical protein
MDIKRSSRSGMQNRREKPDFRVEVTGSNPASPTTNLFVLVTYVQRKETIAPKGLHPCNITKLVHRSTQSKVAVQKPLPFPASSISQI